MVLSRYYFKLIIFRPPKFDFNSALHKVSPKSKHRFLQHQKLLQGYSGPTTEIEGLLEDAITPKKIATTIEDIEEFRDIQVPIIRQDEIEEYENDEDYSGEMEFEDYL